jgi:hypothetical protein
MEEHVFDMYEESAVFSAFSIKTPVLMEDSLV